MRAEAGARRDRRPGAAARPHINPNLVSHSVAASQNGPSLALRVDVVRTPITGAPTGVTPPHHFFLGFPVVNSPRSFSIRRVAE